MTNIDPEKRLKMETDMVDEDKRRLVARMTQNLSVFNGFKLGYLIAKGFTIQDYANDTVLQQEIRDLYNKQYMKTT